MHVPLTRDECTFSNDQACASECSLYIVLGHEIAWHSVGCSVPGKRGHANPILDSDVAELERLEEKNRMSLVLSSYWVICIEVLSLAKGNPHYIPFRHGASQSA